VRRIRQVSCQVHHNIGKTSEQIYFIIPIYKLRDKHFKSHIFSLFLFSKYFSELNEESEISLIIFANIEI